MKTNDTLIAEVLLTVERLNEVNKMILDIQTVLNSKYMKLKEETRKILTSRLTELEEEINQINFKLNTMKNEYNNTEQEEKSTTDFLVDKFEYEEEQKQNANIMVNINDVNYSQLWSIYDLFNKLSLQYDWFDYRTVIDEGKYSKDYPNFDFDLNNIPEGYDDEEDENETGDCE